jgi:phosphatidylserine decarboxylase
MNAFFLTIFFIALSSTSALYSSPRDITSIHSTPRAWKKMAVSHDKILHFLYHDPVGKVLRFMMTKAWLSQLVGMFCNLRISTLLIPSQIRSFKENYGVDMSDFEQKAYYTSYNDFFTRRLVDESKRPFTKIMDPLYSDFDRAICSPADSYITAIKIKDESTTFMVKGAEFTLEKFIASEQLAHLYKGGMVIVCRLAPHHYHRYHFPFECFAASPQKIRGIYESVNPVTYGSLAKTQVLHVNERRLVHLYSKKNEQHVLMIPVAALFVGAMHFTFHTDNPLYNPFLECKKGAEVGYFEFGGSTVVLIFKPNSIHVKEEILAHSLAGKETEVKAGQQIGTWIGDPYVMATRNAQAVDMLPLNA